MTGVKALPLFAIIRQLTWQNFGGLLKSAFIYYLVPFRLGRMRRFYRAFVQKGDLCFDIGAHLGNRAYVFAQLGATSIACEPQPFLAQISAFLLRKTNSKVLQVCVGREEKEVELLMSESHPTLATTSQEWTTDFTRVFYQGKQVWQSSMKVSQVSIESLIQEYGEPAFCKIDAEGCEHEIISSLKTPLRAISFEYVPAAPRSGLRALEAVGQLADYEYNFSIKEKMQFYLNRWVSLSEIRSVLMSFKPSAFSGDVYARRRENR